MILHGTRFSLHEIAVSHTLHQDSSPRLHPCVEDILADWSARKYPTTELRCGRLATSSDALKYKWRECHG